MSPKYIIVLWILVFMMFAGAAANDVHADWNDEQLRVLELARTIGEEIGMPETIQAIAIQETMLGAFGNKVGDRNLPVGKRSYGVTQVKVATARHVLHLNPRLKDEYFGARPLRQVMDEEIIVLLMTDDEAAIVIAAQYFKYNLDLAQHEPGRSWARAVMAYNQGWGRARDVDNPNHFQYVKDVRDRIVNDVRPYRKELRRQEELRLAAAERKLTTHGAFGLDLRLALDSDSVVSVSELCCLQRSGNVQLTYIHE